MILPWIKYSWKEEWVLLRTYRYSLQINKDFAESDSIAGYRYAGRISVTRSEL